VQENVQGTVDMSVVSDRCMCMVCWRLGLVVVRWSRPTKLLYAGPG